MLEPAPGANRLHNETSPYLLQHASNPVHWLPWGEAAWAEARERNCPVLISIGYAACHWCHVMEHESFVDDAIAQLINKNFVAIKVDREERPDVDAVYMAATQAMNHGRGGWPMTVLTAPNREPFFTGTYLPPYDSPQGMGFSTLLSRAAEIWRSNPENLLEHGREITAFVQQAHTKTPPRLGLIQAAPAVAEAWWHGAIEAAVEQAAADFDPRHGGFGAPPKFLATPTLRLLIRRGGRDRDLPSQELAAQTLFGMTRGGLWDWVGGGFSRYSTDAAWQVPHFEKMLYDNALMARVLVEAHQAFADSPWGDYARATLDFVASSMRHERGGFYTAIDADSEHVEGKYYTWSFVQAHQCLREQMGEDDARAWLSALGMTPAGNWEDGRNIVVAAIGRRDGGAAPACPDSSVAWETVRQALATRRRQRVAPQTDDKILTGHNGLMMTALAKAARAFGSDRYLALGCAAADFILETMLRPDGGLWRTWREGRAQVLGALEDYAYLGEGLLALYEAGAPLRYLQASADVSRAMCRSFADEATGALFATDALEERVLFRPMEGHDTATPSANAVAAATLHRLALHTGDAALATTADNIVGAWQPEATAMPGSYAALLCACLDAALPGAQWVWVGAGKPSGSALWQAAGARFAPEVVWAHGEEKGDLAAWPLLANKAAGSGNDGALYICRGSVCQAPIESVAQLPAEGG